MQKDPMHEASKKLFEYLYLKETPKQAKIIFGFGHFDMKIPERCAQLYLEGFAKYIILTGGIGAGTADLGMPEADAFKNYIQQNYPQIPAENLIVENKSTNTGENLRFSINILQEKFPELWKKIETGDILIVANAFRQRRVELTTKKILPKASLISCPPETSFESECILFEAKGQHLQEQLPGEIKRIMEYPKHNWIVEKPIPHEIKHIWKMMNTKKF